VKKFDVELESQMTQNKNFPKAFSGGSTPPDLRYLKATHFSLVSSDHNELDR